MSKAKLRERFWNKVNKDGPIPTHAPHLGQCWLWTASTNGWGYGRFNDGTRLVGAHRWAYEEAVGPIPDGLSLDHLCRTPLCIRPSHLEPVTHQVNMLRGEGISAQNARVTECPQGHPYNAENTYIRPSRKSRTCRTCHREDEAARRFRAALR